MNYCCERKTNLTLYVANKVLSELVQADTWLGVNDPENLSVNNIIELSTNEYKRVQRDRILKRKVAKVEVEAEAEPQNV